MLHICTASTASVSYDRDFDEIAGLKRIEPRFRNKTPHPRNKTVAIRGAAGATMAASHTGTRCLVGPHAMQAHGGGTQ
jgi:hypothetical protein